jgi:HNH endonuclease
MAKQPVKGMRAFTSHERRVIRAWLIEKYGTYCQICLANGKSAKAAEIDMQAIGRADYAFSIDHIVALADGGSNTKENMWPTHVLCNNLKGSVSGGSSRARRKGVTQTTQPRLAYSSSSY